MYENFLNGELFFNHFFPLLSLSPTIYIYMCVYVCVCVCVCLRPFM